MPDLEAPTPAPRADQHPAVRRADVIARLLDETFTLPGGRSLGIDGLIGLIPGVGDAIGAALSASVLLIAAHAGVKPAILARMAGNVLIELGLGAIPIVGDIFDFVWKANRRNATLLEKAMADPARTERGSVALLVGLGVGLLVVLGAVGYAIIALLGALFGALSGG